MTGNQKLNQAKRLETQRLVAILLNGSHWTRQTLAKKLGVSLSAVSAYKTGKSMGTDQVRGQLRELVAKSK